MKKVPVNNGKYFALVDDEDYEEISKYKWYVAGSKKSYACRQFQLKRVKHYVYMHRQIMGEPNGMVVDHINGDTLDNRKENLRPCTIAQNMINSKLAKSNSTGEKCVYFHKLKNKWYVRTRVCGKDTFRGYFEKKEEAVVARDEVFKGHGEFARTA